MPAKAAPNRKAPRIAIGNDAHDRGRGAGWPVGCDHAERPLVLDAQGGNSARVAVPIPKVCMATAGANVDALDLLVLIFIVRRKGVRLMKRLRPRSDQRRNDKPVACVETHKGAASLVRRCAPGKVAHFVMQPSG